MCTNLLHLPSGLVPCRKCRQCRLSYVNDWVGRLSAEASTSAAAYMVTLTYGHSKVYGVESESSASWLDYSDLQKFFKRVRKAGVKFRYFAVGEYGTLKGRAHWHILVFLKDSVSESGISDVIAKQWGHGYHHVAPFNASSALYVCKYLLKSASTIERSVMHMSKEPSIGAEYLIRLARQYARDGLALQGPYYSVPSQVDKKTGLLRKYYLSGRSLEVFVDAYVTSWREHHRSHIPPSFIVDGRLDKLARIEPVVSIRVRGRSIRPWIDPPYRFEPKWSETLGWIAVCGDRRLYWSFDMEGNRSWQSVIRTETWSETRRLTSHLRDATAYRIASRGK